MHRDQDPARLLVAGPGLIGRKHVELIRQNDAADLAGIVAPFKQQHADFAAEAGVPLFDDLQSALDAMKVDGVIIASPNALHLDQARSCIERGVPALVEKPLASTLADARTMAELSEKAGVPILVGHHRTFNPVVAAAREFVRSPEFGSPVAIQGSALFYKPAAYFASAPWRTQAGGGPLLINLIHEIGLMRSFFGEIASVSAMTSSSIRRFEVEDSAAVTLAFANGAVGTFILSDTAASSKSWEMTTGENPAYPHFAAENCYHMAGTMGSLDFPSMRFRTYLGEAERSWWSTFKEGRIDAPDADPLAIQLDHFLEVIHGAAAPLVSATDGYSNMVVLEAIARSAKSGRHVEIAEVEQ